MSDDQPIACNFTAIDEEERIEHKQNAEAVFKSVNEWMELFNGYAFRIPTETALVEQAGAFIARERKCCPFFTFNLEVSSDGGPVWLKLTGNKEVKHYIKEKVIPQLESSEKQPWELSEQEITE